MMPRVNTSQSSNDPQADARSSPQETVLQFNQSGGFPLPGNQPSRSGAANASSLMQAPFTTQDATTSSSALVQPSLQPQSHPPGFNGASARPGYRGSTAERADFENFAKGYKPGDWVFPPEYPNPRPRRGMLTVSSRDEDYTSSSGRMPASPNAATMRNLFTKPGETSTGLNSSAGRSSTASAFGTTAPQNNAEKVYTPAAKAYAMVHDGTNVITGTGGNTRKSGKLIKRNWHNLPGGNVDQQDLPKHLQDTKRNFNDPISPEQAEQLRTQPKLRKEILLKCVLREIGEEMGIKDLPSDAVRVRLLAGLTLSD